MKINRRNSLALLLLLLTSFSFQAFSQGKTKDLPAPVKVTSVEGITEYTLANGLHVLLFPDPSKATITVNMTYLVGSRMEGYGETGMAHLLEHMVFKGSTKHPNIPQELTAHGARPNGSTWYDRTNYFETFSATDENLRWALDLESDRMVNSFIAKKDLETEFSVVRNEFEMGENYPSGVLSDRVMSTAYLWHNYGKSTIGSKEDIEKVPIENLQAFYRKYYQPDFAVLTVAGKIDEAKTLAMINEYYGPIPRPSRVLQEPYTVEPTQDGERFVELRRVGDVQVAIAGYHICSGSHPDYVAFDILSDVLTNEASGRLTKALVETKKASQAYAYAFALKDPGYMMITAEVLKEKSLNEAKSIMLNLLDSLKYNPVTAEETERAKNKMLKGFDLMYNNSDQVGLAMSEFIAQGDWRLWFIYRDAVKKLTAADVNRVISNYIKPSNRTVGTFIPEEKPDRAIIPARPDVNAMVKDYKGEAAMKSAEAFDPSPANIMARAKNGTIAGGAKYSLLSKSTRGSNVTVQMTLRIGSEASLQNKGTIASMTASMLDKGTKNKTREQINDAMDKLKTEVSIGGGGQTVTINVTTVRENIVAALALVKEQLREPSFPAEEFEKLRQENLSGIEQQRNEPQSLAFNVFNRITNQYAKSDWRYEGTYDEQAADMKAVKLEDVKKFYTDYYNSANATVAVVGDFDEAAVTTAITAILENWNAGQKYERAKEPYFNIASKVEKINTPDKANATLAAGFNLELRDDDPDYPALVMGNYILGGGFLNSRLAVRIRQKEGLSYGVGSWLQADAWDKSGGFGSYAIFNPDNLDKLINAYKEELDKMIKEGFTENELKDARSGYLQSRSVSRSQDGNLAGKLSNYLALNRTLNWDETFEKRVSALTIADVNAAVKKWIDPSKVTYVEVGDFDRKK